MNRRRLFSIVAIVVIVSTATFWVFYPNLLSDDLDKDSENENERTVNYSDLNNLNWWDMAWDFIEYGDIFDPLVAVAAYPNRYGLSSDFYESSEYLIDRLQGMGLIVSYFGNYESVVAFQPGYANDSRAIVFGAHIDTQQSGGPQINRNAIGCSVVTAIASSISQFRLPVDVYYCFYQGSWVIEGADFNNIIRGLWGAEEITTYFQEEQIDVIASFNFAEMLFRDPLQNEEDRIHVDYRNLATHGYYETKYIADIFVSFMKKSGLNIATAVQNEFSQSDHWKFWDSGYPALYIHEGQIRDEDFTVVDSFGTPNYNYTQAIIAAKAAAATAVYLGMKGNGEISRQKMYYDMDAGDVEILRMVTSIPQRLRLEGIVSDNQSVYVQISQSGTMILNSTLITDINFTLGSSINVTLGPLLIKVINQGNDAVQLRLNVFYESDLDGNGISDSEQYHWPDPDPPLDWDHDGLSDMDELAYDTDMFHPDTDRDGMSDNNEVLYGLEPLRRDAREDKDADGLLNQREIRIGTHPGLNDTDMDSMLDEWEVVFQTNPLLNDSALDLDGDNLTNIQEYLYGSDPRSVDGDYDGVPDFMEYQLGMNALNDDTDQDGLRDLIELQEGLDPLVADSDIDFEIDGFDHNPRVNTLLVLVLVSLVPVSIGTFIFWRRVRQ